MLTSGNALTTPQAGIAFTGCAMMGAASASGSRPSGHGHAHAHAEARRREVVVNGKRIKTVDVHAHCCVPKAMAVIDHPLEAPGLLMADTSVRIAAMDSQGIDVEALSINPYWYRAGRDAAAELIRIQNETLVEFCAANPERFVAYATAALQHPDLAAEQVEHAVKKLGFRGVSVGGSVAGEELANPRFHPFWKKCEELGVLVFMHPTGTRELEPSGRLGGSGLLTNTIGNPLETTIALSHLIFEGTLDRFPGLKICAAHGGGFLPSYANRSDAVIKTFPNRVGPLPKKPPTAYLRDGQLFFDTIVFTPEALRHLIAETGPGQIMIGTDYPFPWTSTEIDLVLATPGLSDDERIAILGGTAARLLGIAP
jgi:aminocarboxymuconate-semialdehyde decarboxylase